MLEIKLSNYAVKFLRSCEKEIYNRVINKIKELSENPFPLNAKRVVNEKEKTFRVRVRDFRILYVVFNDLGILFISDIDKRSRIYKN